MASSNAGAAAAATVVIVVLCLIITLVAWRSRLLFTEKCRSIERCTDLQVHWRDLAKVARNGDVLLQSSVAWWGPWSRYLMGSDFTHAGVLWLSDVDTTNTGIDASAGGGGDKTPYMAELLYNRNSGGRSHMQLQPIEKILNDGYSLVVRVIGTDADADAGTDAAPKPRDRAPLDTLIENYHVDRGVCINYNVLRLVYMLLADTFGFLKRMVWLERFVRMFDAPQTNMCTNFVDDVLEMYTGLNLNLNLNNVDKKSTPGNVISTSSPPPSPSYTTLPHSYCCNDRVDEHTRFVRTFRIVGDYKSIGSSP